MLPRLKRKVELIMDAKGKKVFTRAEADEIRQLLCKKEVASREAQKTIRAKIRKIGFRISQYTHSTKGFTARDFDNLIRSGRISIIAWTL